ncbi:MAG: dephospho-CoA kinase [bacterium]|nr:MAG: dephospho-CoA kinase [bacterium]
MRVIAITGGLGSGKSTVRRILEEMGAVGVDADELARKVVEPGTEGALRVRDAFGDRFFDSEGRLRRKDMAELVFSDQEARAKLEGILHPLIREEEKRVLQEIAARDPQCTAAVEIPLLAEGKRGEAYDLVINVTATMATRIRRLVEAKRYSRREAEARIRSQATDLDRLKMADYTVDNSGTEAETRRQLESIWRQLGPEPHR